MTPLFTILAAPTPSGALVLASGDTGDFLKVNSFARHTSWLHGVMTQYAGKGVLLFAVLLVGGYLLARSRGQMLLLARALLAGAGVLLAVAVNQPIVHAVNEPRPYTQLPHILLLVHRSADASFPSDHATMAGAVAVGLLFLDRKLGILATIAALLMAFARVYVGAHFPIDVLAGLLVGSVVAAPVQLAARPVAQLLDHLQGTRMRRLLTAATPVTPAWDGEAL